MGWLERVKDTRTGLVGTVDKPEARMSIEDLAAAWSQFSFNGVPYTTYGTSLSNPEQDDHSFLDYVQNGYKTDGVIFAVILSRMLLFSEARFQYQRMRKGRPGDLYGDATLALLETPWPNGTTGELLARMEQDVSLSGNAYLVRETNRIRRLRPDWVRIILTAPPNEAVQSDVAGYLYTPGGFRNAVTPVTYLPEEIAHWSPIPDPEAQYRGMSWLTPVVREIAADQAATNHKLRFFKNAATPNLAISFKESVTKEQFEEFMNTMNSAHQGSNNAYKTLYLGGGADVQVIGADMKQLDFKATQGAGETRICAAGGVPPVIVGLSEGLQSATYSNYGMARRKFGDHWARPQWRSACSALAKLAKVPAGSRLWYDDRDIAFLREDQKDVADIFNKTASTMKMFVDAGWSPDSVVLAMTNEDLTLLEHSGLYSVQLQPPGTVSDNTPPPAIEPATPPNAGGTDPVPPVDPASMEGTNDNPA
jgi:phage portal protein BeeE